MKILDIRGFRDYFKSHIRQTADTNRDPHFAGHSMEVDGETVFGFFDLYHGVKPDMENLLKTILDMARDSQALYEFVQNAVDAKSTDFVLFHHKDPTTGQDYLVVVNNGKPFDLKGILAILNIGASNKYRDVNSIGQFGVGFKLAHRLVGEETGLKALLEENKGPVLFSWRNNELQELADADGYEPVDLMLTGKGEKASYAAVAPWLLKILYTNFPCTPNDSIIDAKERTMTDAFSDAENAILKSVAQRCLDSADGRDYSTGTLLLIPLHENKVQELTEDAHRYGLEISTAILNQRSGEHRKLEQITLNGQHLSKIEPHAELFRFPAADFLGEDGKTRLFESIDILEIDLLYGDPLSGDDSFAGKPQFYLYFPMTEERHGFRFAIHCNAFSFTSARTALQENTVRNKRIFELLVSGLRDRLTEYAGTDRPRFERLYLSLLLSERGDNGEWKENRQWLEEELWVPLKELLLDHIPVRSEGGELWRLAVSGESINIKDSALPIESWATDETAWCLWDGVAQPQVCRKAVERLGLTPVTLIDVIRSGEAITAMNEWLGAEDANSKELLKELDSRHHLVSALDKDQIRTFWDNFAQLSVWSFKDGRASIDELSTDDEQEGRLIAYGPLEDLAELLERSDIQLSRERLGSFPALEQDIRSRNASKLDYLRNFKALNLTLNGYFNRPGLYGPADKQKIFLTLNKAVMENNSVAERVPIMKVLALFENKRNEVKSLQGLIQRDGLPKLLAPWEVKGSEIEGLNISEYTAGTDGDIYEQVVLTCWQDIANLVSTGRPAERKALFTTVKAFYDTRPTAATLPSAAIFFSKQGLPTSGDQQYYHNTLSEFTNNEYEGLSSVCERSGIGALPDHDLLPFYAADPFLLIPDNDPSPELEESGVEVTLAEAAAFIRLFQRSGSDGLTHILFRSAPMARVVIMNGDPAITQVASSDKSVAAFITSYCNDRMLLLPEALIASAKYIKLSGDDLLFALIGLELSKEGIADLLRLIRDKGTEAHKEVVLRKIAEDMPLDIREPLVEFTSNVIRTAIALTDAAKRAELLGQLFFIDRNGRSERLNEITSKGSDELVLMYEDRPILFSIADLLQDDTNLTNQLLTKCAYDWSVQNLGTLKDIQEALGSTAMRDVEDVWEALLEQLGDSVIDNGEQLAFLLCYGAGQEELPDELMVETSAGPMKLVDSTFYLNEEGPAAFIPTAYLLSERYESLRARLINEQRQELQVSNSRILVRPYIDNDILVLPCIDGFTMETARTAFLNFLYQLWENTGRLPIYLPENAASWSPFLGFEPRDLVISDDGILEEERVDYELLSTIAADKEVSNLFLVALGSHSVDSPLMLWRKWLTGFGELPKLNLGQSQVYRTLKWLDITTSDVIEDRLMGLYAPLVDPDVSLLRLPAYRNGLLRICSPSQGLYFLTAEQHDRLAAMDVTIEQVSERCEISVIPPLKGLGQIWDMVTAGHLPLEIDWDSADREAIDEMAHEWTYPYYQDWSRLSGKHIYDLPGQTPRSLIIHGLIFKRFKAGDAIGSLDGTDIYINSELNMLITFERLQQLDLLDEDAVNILRSAYLESSSRLTTLIERIKGNDDLAEALDRFLDYAQQQQEKHDAAQRLQDRKNFYTMQWFEDLLDLVKIQERISSAPSVEFSGIRSLDDATNIYELTRPSDRIPSDIETYDHISAKITYRNNQGGLSHFTTTLEATRKNQSLWVRFTDVNVEPVLQRTVIGVTLTFGRVTDLIQALRRGFASLSYDSEHDLKATLSPNIDFLFGPPGTGKTTELARRLIAQMDADGPDGPVIVLTPTNKAADVLAKKVIARNGGIAPDWLVRFGTCTDPELLEAGAVGQRDDTFINESTRKVLITTIHRFPYDKVGRSAGMADKQPLYDCPWSLVIFDEASMIPLPYIVYAIHKRALGAPDTAFIVAGDPLQIPPVFDLITEELDNADILQKENIYTMVGLDTFDEELQRLIPVYGENGRIENLPVQHRSIPAIGELFGRFQYGGKIGHSRGTPDNARTALSRALPKFFERFGIKPITVVRYKVGSTDSIYDPKKLNNSPVHLHSALLVNEFMKRFQKEVEAEKAEKWTVGIISPYRSQATLMDKMIEDSLHYSERLEVNIDTVHGFQGDENQMVIAVLNPSSANAQYSRFLKEAHILNVAISRAEDYLILFIPDEDTNGLWNLPLIAKGHRDSILDIISTLTPELCCEIDAATLELALMEEVDYFEKYTRTTVHLPVNVYRELQTPYLFRISGNAVDVHWKNE